MNDEEREAWRAVASQLRDVRPGLKRALEMGGDSIDPAYVLSLLTGLAELVHLTEALKDRDAR